jgi:hypothetical protein
MFGSAAEWFWGSFSKCNMAVSYAVAWPPHGVRDVRKRLVRAGNADRGARTKPAEPPRTRHFLLRRCFRLLLLTEVLPHLLIREGIPCCEGGEAGEHAWVPSSLVTQRYLCPGHACCRAALQICPKTAWSNSSCVPAAWQPTNARVPLAVMHTLCSTRQAEAPWGGSAVPKISPRRQMHLHTPTVGEQGLVSSTNTWCRAFQA